MPEGGRKSGCSKRKFALWVQPDTLKKVEKLYRDDDCKSRSEFIEKAILFYAGYLTANDYRGYFPNVIVSTVKGTLDSLENRGKSALQNGGGAVHEPPCHGGEQRDRRPTPSPVCGECAWKKWGVCTARYAWRTP